MSLTDLETECPCCGGAIPREDAPRRPGCDAEVLEIGYIHCDHCGKLWEWKKLVGGQIRGAVYDDHADPKRFRRAKRRLESARAA